MSELVSLEMLRELIQQYGYPILFLGISMENAGIPVPGESITILGGFLAGSGELNYWFVLVSVFAGAVLGDNFGYWLGKWGGWAFLLRLGKLFRIRQEKLQSLRKQFQRHARRTVFLGRFVALLRIFAGPIAGIAGMPYREFCLYNAAGAAVWAAVTVSLAFSVGRVISLQALVSGMSSVGLVALVVAIVAIALPHWLGSRSPAKS